jgi:hypothetical protein
MKALTNLLISMVVFFIAISIAAATGIENVLRVVILAFLIQWIAFIPAYVFQTEKFYDLTGSITYLSVMWYSLILSSDGFHKCQWSKYSYCFTYFFMGTKTGKFFIYENS